MNFNSICRVIMIGCGAIFLGKFAQNQTDTFTIRAITSDRSHYVRFETHPLNVEEQKELEQALSQPYYYYGWGGQVYVFFSEDGKYTLKFLKQRLFRRPWLLNHLPLPKLLHRFRDKRNWKRKDKFERDFFSYKVSFDEMQKESGLLYCHLNQTHDLNNTLEIIDRLGIHHFLELDRFDFLLQRKAERVVERLKRLESDPEALQETFREILTLTKRCIDKGYYNRDPFIPHNCGFVGNQAIQIDVGRFLKRPYIQTEEGQKKELARILIPFEEWLMCHYPHLTPFFREEANKW